MARLLLGDRLPLVVAALTRIAEDAGFEVVGASGDEESSTRLIDALDPDIAMLDAAIGLARLRRQRAADEPRPRLILLADAAAEGPLAEAVDLEVDGLVLRDTAPEQVARCLEAVASGEQWIDNDALRRALDELERRETGAIRTKRLTPREMDVARLAAKGLRNRDIGGALGLTEGTVKLHLNRIFAKLRIDGRAALAAKARELGLD